MDTTRDIRTAFVLDGEANFKKAMKDIGQEMRLLDAELGKTTVGFDKNADAMKILSATSDTLKKKMDVQKQKIESVSKELDVARKATKENKEEIKKYEIELALAETKLGKLKNELKDNDKKMEDLQNSTDDAGNELKDFEKKIDSAGDKADKSSGRFSGFGDVLQNGFKAGAVAAAAAIVLVTAAAIEATKAIINLASESGDWADELITTANQTNVSTQTLQEWAYAARFIDTEIETMTKGLGKVVKATGEAAKAGDDYISIGEDVSVSIRDASGNLKDSEQIFYDSIDAIKGMTDETEREIATQDLFGKSYQDMMPLIQAGSEGLKKYADEANNTGVVLDEGLITKLGEYDDVMERIDAKQDALKKSFVVNFIPALEAGMGAISEIMDVASSALEDGFQPEDISTIGAVITTTLTDIISGIGDVLPEVTEVVTTLITEVIGIASDLLPTLLPVIITGAFTLLQSLMDAITDNVQPLSDMVIQLVLGIVDFIVQNLPLVIDAALQIIIALVTGIAEALPELIPAVVGMIIQICDTLIANLPALIEASLSIILALVQGLAEALPQLIEYVPELISSIVVTLIENLPMLVEAALQIMLALVAGLIEALPELLMMGPEIGKTLGESLGTIDWGKFGGDMMDGLAKGITDGLGAIGDAAERVAEKVTSYLHFSRPDVGPLREYEAWMPDMMSGLAGGIRNNTNKVLGETKALALGMSDSLALPEINNKVSNELLSSSETGGVSAKKTVEHTGTIRFEGVNNEGELISAIDVVLSQLRRDKMLAGTV